MATTEHELWLDEMPKKRVKNKDELRQDPALPQVDAVVMNDTADGPGAMDSSHLIRPAHLIRPLFQRLELTAGYCHQASLNETSRAYTAFRTIHGLFDESFDGTEGFRTLLPNSHCDSSLD